MFINYVSDYIPEGVLSNTFFYSHFGVSEEEIFSKSGIKERHLVQSDENTNTMAIDAVKNAFFNLPFPITEIDLIIGVTYTPYDTIGTLAHAVQGQFKIPHAKCFTVDSACSSFVNAVEIVDCFFTANKASKALIVVSENNSLYNDVSDMKSGFLWGDGAAAVFITNERCSEDDFEIVDVNTSGLGHVGKNIEAVYLKPCYDGLKIPYGKDVFQNACTYMIKDTKQILEKNKISLNRLNYFIPHQANARITNYIAKELNLNSNQVLTNIEFLGNTGSASTPIVLSQNKHIFKHNDIIVISVFGGGYSCGSLLINKL